MLFLKFDLIDVRHHDFIVMIHLISKISFDQKYIWVLKSVLHSFVWNVWFKNNSIYIVNLTHFTFRILNEYNVHIFCEIHRVIQLFRDRLHVFDCFRNILYQGRFPFVLINLVFINDFTYQLWYMQVFEIDKTVFRSDFFSFRSWRIKEISQVCWIWILLMFYLLIVFVDFKFFIWEFLPVNWESWNFFNFDFFFQLL